jgi:hypothetical protein
MGCNKKLSEKLIAYLHLMHHAPHRKQKNYFFLGGGGHSYECDLVSLLTNNKVVGDIQTTKL